MTPEQKVYFDLKYGNRIEAIIKVHMENHTNNKSDKDKNTHIKDVKIAHPVTVNYIKNKFNNQSKYTYEDCKLSFEKDFKEYIEKYAHYYNDERAFFFKDPYQLQVWFENQKNKCGYCEITYDELQKLVQKRGDNLTLNNKKKRSKGSMEIERKVPAVVTDPNYGYIHDNCILACPFCNNAKSNLIDEELWKEIFVPAMKIFYKIELS
jgi:hypothetical protein